MIEEPGITALLRLDTVQPADKANDDTQALHDAIATNAQKAIADDIATLFTAAVAQKAGISLDQTVLSSVNTQLGN